MGKVKFNFSAGPAVLPEAVLKEAAQAVVDCGGTGLSILCMSHRGGTYEAFHMEALANLRDLLRVPDDFAILLLQGGATQQFSQVAMNLAQGKPADYTLTGQWAEGAFKEAGKVAAVRVAADSRKVQPARVPLASEIKVGADAAYLHITTNETVDGIQWTSLPDSPVPLVADMSSDIMSRDIPWNRFSLVYAGAQKNLGPAGVTVVIVRKDVAEKAPSALPAMLRYQTHVEKDSLHNTPPCFSIYVLALVTRWVKAQGGVAVLEQRNRAKAAKLYAAIDGSGFYRGTADKAYRSIMNVTYRLPNEDLEKTFVKEAEAAGLSGLKGHRVVGGLRASIYNAMPESGVDALIQFMKDFQGRHS
ncbi:MAG: 3-phosphoserine/phosphohydroxythreonine transaminase [Elusimicrobia bacterium]|nr:3-phosphoserine/phosphohydroxythreonine transaminase [Elusimicrobiota bacterium]MBP9698706.1 3-phosphoserine/phosphohydroxythreonine transaminase [Elusimicrobiota bacterium]